MKLLLLAATAILAAPAVAQMAPDPTGGYQPATAPTAGTFQQAPAPSDAYPAPAPMAAYPKCKAGQTDHCVERSTASGAGARDGTPRHESRKYRS